MATPKSPPNPAGRPTLRVIAAKADLSLTATSMALRNHPGISAATRARVQALARELGYHPDPKLASLMQHLRTQSGTEYRETIAFLSQYPDYKTWKSYSQHDYYTGAVDRAAELGYRVELFHLGSPGMTPQRMSDLLKARGIRGLLVAGAEKPGGRLELDWTAFAAITFSYSLAWPDLHRATTDYYREMISTLARLRAEGCERIGLHVKIADDNKAFNFWRSAYLFHEDSIPAKDRIPMHTAQDDGATLPGWLKTHRPDAVISAGCDLPRDYERAHGKPPPARIRYINMNIYHGDERSRGIDQDSYSVGRLACGHLVTLLQRNEIGLPAQPQVISIEGRWVENYPAWLRSLGKRTKPAHPRPAAKSGVRK